MHNIKELKAYLEECHASTCVDGSMDYMRGFSEGFRAAIATLASYNPEKQLPTSHNANFQVNK